MIATKDKQQKSLATWTEPEPLRKRGRPYIIPRYYVDPDNGLTDLKEYPKQIIGDTDLVAVLQTSKQSLHKWKKKGIIPFEKKGQAKPIYHYNIREVVTALEKYYFRDNE